MSSLYRALLWGQRRAKFLIFDWRLTTVGRGPSSTKSLVPSVERSEEWPARVTCIRHLHMPPRFSRVFPLLGQTITMAGSYHCTVRCCWPDLPSPSFTPLNVRIVAIPIICANTRCEVQTAAIPKKNGTMVHRLSSYVLFLII